MNTPVIRDWTHETLVVDVVNSLGETYHFEVEPGADPGSIPSRHSNSTNDKASRSVYVEARFWIPVQLDMLKNLTLD